MKTKQLDVHVPGATAGQLHRESQYVFNYTTTERANEVSLAMPIRAQSYSSNSLMPVFSMNLPEGYLYDRIVRRMAKHAPINEMRLLAITGQQQIGRLRFAQAGDRPLETRPRIGLDTLLRETATDRLFEFLVETYFDGGISGVQPKVMMPDADKHPVDSDLRVTLVHSDLIVKSAGADFPALTQNEYLCMDAARRAGIAVPEFWLSDDGGLFVMRRFDLEPALRGFEDLSVLMGKPRDAQGNYKYTGSYEDITRTIAAYSGPNTTMNLHAFFEYLALSVMVRNGDAHLKNFGLQYDNPTSPQCVLSPLYDVVTTTIYPYVNQRTQDPIVDRTMALKLFTGANDRNYPTHADLTRFGREVCHTQRPDIVLDRIATAMGDALRENRSRFSTEYAQLIETEWNTGIAMISSSRRASKRKAKGRDT
jgi:serine/threonine-protein kinase HipA